MDLSKLIPLDGEGYFNIFGFRMRTDDLLILAILFFLYTEQVDDMMLYIVLVLLLIA